MELKNEIDSIIELKNEIKIMIEQKKELEGMKTEIEKMAYRIKRVYKPVLFINATRTVMWITQIVLIICLLVYLLR